MKWVTPLNPKLSQEFVTSYSKKEQVKLVEDSLFNFFKGVFPNFTWFILEYFIPFSFVKNIGFKLAPQGLPNIFSGIVK